MKKYIVFGLIGLVILFLISSMPYEQQTIIPELKTLLSDKPLYDFLSKFEFTYWGRTISVETRGYYYFVEFLIRKAFHVIGYGIIGLLIYLLYRKLKLKLAIIYAIVTTFSIACLDELRQTFVSGRTGVFDDVLLDTMGAITFIIGLKLLFVIKELLFSRHKKSSI